MKQDIHDFLFKEFHIPKVILDKSADCVAEYQKFLKMNMRSEQKMTSKVINHGGCSTCIHREQAETYCNDCGWGEKWEGEKMPDPDCRTIKDSGDRTEFSTGAVRDMREGKGRCDLMPLEVVVDIMGDVNAKEMLYNIHRFLKSGDTGYLVRCLTDFARRIGGHHSYTADICTMFLEVAKHFEEGAKKYGENNWQKGIPVNCYIDSAIRHYLKWLRGDTDEPHDRAFVWNLMCCIWEVDYRDKEADAK